MTISPGSFSRQFPTYKRILADFKRTCDKSCGMASGTLKILGKAQMHTDIDGQDGNGASCKPTSEGCTECQDDGEFCAVGEDAAQLCHQDEQCARIGGNVLIGIAYDACKALEPSNEPPTLGQHFPSISTGHHDIKWL